MSRATMRVAREVEREALCAVEQERTTFTRNAFSRRHGPNRISDNARIAERPPDSQTVSSRPIAKVGMERYTTTRRSCE